MDKIEAAVKVENDEDEDEEEDRADAEEAIEYAAEAVAEAQAAVADKVSTDEDGLEVAEEYLAKAETAFADKEYNAAYEWAEKAEDKAEIIVYGPDEDDGTNKRWTTDKCDSNPGIGNGVNEKCDDDYRKLEPSHDKYKDYGKSDDRAELESQLQELMQLLIQLLTLQLAQQS
jgi:hypothetical protein